MSLLIYNRIETRTDVLIFRFCELFQKMYDSLHVPERECGMGNDHPRQYIASDLKSFYASVECVARGLDPLKANLLVADESRTDKTIVLAVSPALKSIGVPNTSACLRRTATQRWITSLPRPGWRNTSGSVPRYMKSIFAMWPRRIFMSIPSTRFLSTRPPICTYIRRKPKNRAFPRRTAWRWL